MRQLRVTLLISIFSLVASAQDHYVVRAPKSAIADIAARHGALVVKSLSGSGQDLHVLSVPNWSKTQIVQSLQSDPQVQWVEHDEALSVPEATNNGPQPRPHSGSLALSDAQNMRFYYNSLVWGAYLNQPASGLIGIPNARQMATGSGIVAFLDSGVDFLHPALASSLVMGYDLIRGWPGGSDTADLFSQFVPMLDDQSTTPILDQSTTPILDDSIILEQSTTPILDDDSTIPLNQSTTPILDGFKAPHAFGHGTMVAGLIHLVAPTAKLMPVKVFSSDGTSTLSLVIEGIYYAVDHGAKVINMSFSFSGTSPELTNAINYANSHRVIMVAAVGNNGQNIVLYPAGYNQVMGIGSTSNQETRSTFSNYGSAVTLAAPGEGLITTYPFNHYAAGWGTSFSTPLVAGAAALLVDLDSNVNEAQAQHALSHAEAVGQGMGAGVLDLVQACQSLKGNGQNQQ